MLDAREQERFCAARRGAIEGEFSHLNPQQRQGVLATEGPLLLLAGAGSGKTTVLINRVTNLLRFGRGADSDEVPEHITPEDLDFLEQYGGRENSSPQEVLRMEELCTLAPARPWEILAITFTNKAAGELKERLERTVGTAALDVWAATFHSACVRILRREIELLGLPRSFTIYDTDDSLQVIKACLKELNIDDKTFPPRSVLSQISKAKDAMQGPRELAEAHRGSSDLRMGKIAQIYGQYQRRLDEAGALDFDDLILKTVQILQQFPRTREYYQRKFRYVLVDEYQDTNHLQYMLSTLLAGGRKNFCVVGDDDQSIYRFRGATIENIMSFEQEYPGARVIRLEQNYRSTACILAAANAVIGNNVGRKGKNLWTEHESGDKIQVFQAMNEQDEALHVAAQILTGRAQGRNWRDHVILYRMNAQSNQMEMALKRNAIPYRILSGLRFFERAEIKDVLAYLWVLQNPRDDLRLSRIINVPARGIGARSLEIAQQLAREQRISLWDVVRNVRQYPALQKAAPRFVQFVNLMESLQEQVQSLPLPELYDRVLRDTGYMEMLKEKPENATKLENVQELKSTIVGYLENALEPTLSGFLDEVSLYTDMDTQEDADNCVVMMTMHAAKGLEFPVVFAVGMEEGIFPSFRTIGEREELEEERRLCYVAMTRAREQLHLTCAGQRMLYGKTSANLPSRFVREIPEDLVEKDGRDFAWQNDEPFETQWQRPSYGTGFSAAGETAASGDIARPAAAPRQRVAYRNPSASAPLPAFAKGDMVQHEAFGSGMLLSVQPMGGDALLEVAFDNVGTKRLMLKAAAAHMKKI